MIKAGKKTNYKKYYHFHRSRLISKSAQVSSFFLSPSPRLPTETLEDQFEASRMKSLSSTSDHSPRSKTKTRSNSLPNLNSSAFSLFSEDWLQSSILRQFEQTSNPLLRIEACKIVRKWVKLTPQRFPQPICASLVAVAESDQDDLQDFALELLRLLTVKNCALVSRCGGLQVLIKSLLNAKCSQFFSENLALTFSFLLNEGQTREYFNDGKEILRIFAVFVDPEGMNMNQKEVVVKNIRNTLVLMVRSWAGLIYLTSYGLPTLIRSLNQKIDSWIKEEIIDMILEMIDVQTNTTVTTFNLINNYLAMLLRALINSGISEVLIKLINNSDKILKFKAEKLAVSLSKLLKDLIPAVQDLQKFLESKNLSIPKEKSRVSNYLSTCFDYISEKSLLNSIKNHENPFFLEFIQNQFDELGLVRQIHQSKVHKSHKKWKWKIIFNLLSGPLEQDNKFLMPQSIQFIHALVSYFTPSKNLFHLLPWHASHFIKARAAKSLIELLLMKEEGCLILNSTFSEGFFQTRKSFLHEFSEALDEELKFLTTGEDGSFRIFSSEKVKNCMARECFMWLEIFFKYPQGRKLLKANKITGQLMGLFNVEHLAVLLLNILDYSKQKWRNFLELVFNSNDRMRLKALECLKSLYRSGTKDLSWSVEYLKSQLVSKNSLVISSTLGLLEELTNEHINLLALLRLGPQELFFLDKAGKRVLYNFLKFAEGISYLSAFGFLEQELDRWDQRLNNKYARSIELSIEKGLEPQKTSFRFYLPAPLESKGKEISWASRLPFSILVIAENHKRVELDPVILPTVDGFELLGVLETLVFFHDGLAAGLTLGLVSIDSTGNDSFDENLVGCPNVQSKEVLKDGVTFSFINNQLKTVRFSFKLYNDSFKSSTTKKHLFGELSRTLQGVETVKKLGFIKSYFFKLQKSCSTLVKRSYLWALGHFGSNDTGALVLKELEVIQLIARIAEDSSTLSLRGTAFQTLSLICRSSIGRAELGLVGWTWSGSSLIAFPLEPEALFRIPKAESFLPYIENLYHLEEELKNCRLSQAEAEVLKLVTGLGSFHNRSKCEAALRNMRRSFPGLFLSSKLFKSVIEVISGYKFSLAGRMFVHRLFDVLPMAHFDEIDAISYIFNN